MCAGGVYVGSVCVVGYVLGVCGGVGVCVWWVVCGGV